MHITTCLLQIIKIISHCFEGFRNKYFDDVMILKLKDSDSESLVTEVIRVLAMTLD